MEESDIKGNATMFDVTDGPVKCRQMGKFEMDFASIKEDWEIAQQILSEVIVVRADNDFLSGKVGYTAFSTKFRPVPDHEMIPWYQAIIHKGYEPNSHTGEEDWTITVEWREMVGHLH